MSSGRLNLSGVQVCAGLLATLTGAVAASFLGVAGTLVGAAVGSLASTVGTEVYRHYLGRTHERLRGAVETYRYRSTRSTVAGPADPTVAQNRQGVTSRRQVNEDVTETQVLHAQGPGEPAHGAVTASRPTSPNDPRPDSPTESLAAAAGRPQTGPAGSPGVTGTAAGGSNGKRKRPRWLVLAAVAAGTFVIVMAAITVFELSVGKTLSATVKGQAGSGTTLSGVVGGQTTKPSPPAQQVATPSATPTVSSSSGASVPSTSSASVSSTPTPSGTVSPGDPIAPSPGSS